MRERNGGGVATQSKSGTENCILVRTSRRAARQEQQSVASDAAIAMIKDDTRRGTTHSRAHRLRGESSGKMRTGTLVRGARCEACVRRRWESANGWLDQMKCGIKSAGEPLVKKASNLRRRR